MAKTDNPLKNLVTAFIGDFAAWLLDTEIQAAISRNIELPPGPDPVKSDQVFHVTLADGRTVILHIEFQGPATRHPMHLRMLDDLARLAEFYRPHGQSQSAKCTPTRAGQSALWLRRGYADPGGLPHIGADHPCTYIATRHQL